MTFCVKCLEKESEFEVLRNMYFQESTQLKEQIKQLNERIEKMQQEVESLSLDVAFYGGGLINLSCNNK